MFDFTVLSNFASCPNQLSHNRGASQKVKFIVWLRHSISSCAKNESGLVKIKSSGRIGNSIKPSTILDSIQLCLSTPKIYKRATHHKYMMIIKILFTINIFRRKSRFSASLVQQLVCCWFMFQGSAKWNFTYCRISRGSRELTFWPTFYCLLRFSPTCSTHRRQRRRAKYIELSSFPFATQ